MLNLPDGMIVPSCPLLSASIIKSHQMRIVSTCTENDAHFERVCRALLSQAVGEGESSSRMDAVDWRERCRRGRGRGSDLLIVGLKVRLET